jgi:hypothetical protein
MITGCLTALRTGMVAASRAPFTRWPGILATAALAMSGCGGGGGGGNNPPPGGSPPRPGDVSMSVSPLHISVSATVAQPAPSANFQVSVNGLTVGQQVYLAGKYSKHGIASLSDSSGSSPVTVTIQFDAPATLSAGVYSDTVELMGCYDQACTQQITNSPQTVQVQYTVSGSIVTVTSLNPSNTVATGPGFVLTVTGTNFTPRSVVMWSGSALSTTYVSATRLTAQVAATDIAAAGTAAISVSDPVNGASNALNFTIQPWHLPAPSGLSYRSPQTFYVGTAMSLAPMVTGTVTSYAVSPALPAGLTLNTSSGLISGTPAAVAAAANYTVTATNSAGSTNFALSIAVVLLPPKALSYPNPQSLAVGTQITPLNPFVAGLVSSYSVSPALPAGLSLDPTSGQISGTPTAPAAAATYTITATNASGSSTFGLSIAVLTVGVTPAQISRLVAAGTPVVVQLAVQSASLTGTLYVNASDAYGLFTPAAAVATTANGYTVSLTISSTLAAGHYSGTVTLSLCKDAACTTHQAPSSIALPFDVQVLSAASAWPGDHDLPLAAWNGVPDWTMFQGNAAHTGYVPVSIDPNNFTTRWQGGPSLSNTPNNYNGAFAYTLTTDAGQLYVATGTTLYALSELDGSQIWSYTVTVQFPSVNPPAEANGTVYMAGGQQDTTYLFAFDEKSGSIVFQSPMSSQWEHYFAPTIGPNGIYTNAGTYGGMYGFDFSGHQLFFDTLAQVSQWTPAVDGNSVYAYTGVLTVADPATGAATATIQDPTYQNYEYLIDGSPVLGAPGSVFAANYTNAYINGGAQMNTLLDFDVNKQTISWQLTGDYGYNPAYNAGVLYAVNNSPLQLEARSEGDGLLLWSWTPPQAGDNTFDSEVLLTNSMIFVSTNLATYGVDAVTHQLVFSYPFAGRLALSHNGILYIQGTGPIVAINVK